MSQVVIKAYAKVNLVLDVLNKRDDGYHEVEMIMQAIGLYDEVIIKPAAELSIQTNHPLVPDDSRNLAYQAAQLLQKKYPQISGADIIINKKIPVEAGLAGGSTDAAAVILGLNKLFGLNMPKTEMLQLAAQLGSDVPFCIGGPTALAQGRGEIIEEISHCPQLWLVLVKPEFGVRTPEVYRALRIPKANEHPNIDKYMQALKLEDVDYICDNLANVLETSTFKLYPQVKDIKEGLLSLGAQNVLMSGSGPTVFALFKTEQEAYVYYQQVQKHFTQVFMTHTVSDTEIKERVNIYE